MCNAFNSKWYEFIMIFQFHLGLMYRVRPKIGSHNYMQQPDPWLMLIQLLKNDISYQSSKHISMAWINEYVARSCRRANRMQLIQSPNFIQTKRDSNEVCRIEKASGVLLLLFMNTRSFIGIAIVTLIAFEWQKLWTIEI